MRLAMRKGYMGGRGDIRDRRVHLAPARILGLVGTLYESWLHLAADDLTLSALPFPRLVHARAPVHLEDHVHGLAEVRRRIGERAVEIEKDNRVGHGEPAGLEPGLSRMGVSGLQVSRRAAPSPPAIPRG